MPIKDNNGKVIVSLLAGATAGIVAGLLLAPEAGDDTRKTLAQSADKLWSGSLGELVKGALARFTGPTDPAAAALTHVDKQAADERLQNLGAAEPGDLTAPAGAGNGRSVGGDEV
ncbi:MAG: YtxH domain-containing protein [Janthinobacterium lividum]